MTSDDIERRQTREQLEETIHALKAEQLLLQQKLELSDTELRSVFLELPDLVVWFDSSGTISREERGSAPERYPSAEELAANPTLFKARRKSQRTKLAGLLELDIEVGGRQSEFEVHLMPLRQGETLCVVRNVSERVEGMRALAKEKERLATTLRSIGDAVLTTDRHGRVDLLNRAAERLIGIEASTASGRLIEDVLDFSGSDVELRDRVVDVQATGADWSIEAVRLRASDGVEYIVDLRAAAIIERTAITGVVVVFRDVGERVRIVEERLRASKLESLGLLAGGIAHDFNNILQALLGSLSLAEHRYRLGEDITNLLGRARRASTRARDLTKQLLAVSKGGAPVKSVVSLRELLIEASTFATRGAKSRCDFRIAHDLNHVEIDSGQMSQVVHNLVLNALQAMPEGGEIQVGAVNEGSFVCISVSDSGCGISYENFSKLFDPYFTTKETGSGLGLYTAYVVVKRHGGSIGVESTVATGTTFSVRLPVSKRPFLGSTIGEEAVQGGRGRVLVVDDQEGARTTTAEMLTYLGYAPDSASEGDEALELFKASIENKDQFGIALLDLTIPGGKGGAEIVREIAKLDVRVRAIAMTGYTNDEIVERYEDFGFDAVLVKPFTVLELDRALRATK